MYYSTLCNTFACMTEKTKLISMRLPVELLAEVDARAKQVGKNRTEWFIRVARWALDEKKGK